MAETMHLIAGRSAKQGAAVCAGKLKGDYRRITSTVEMNADDMARLGLKDGDKVELSSDAGKTVVTCAGRKAEDLPAGVLFIPYGPPSSRLMDGDTTGTGMPISKNLKVEVRAKTAGRGR